MRTEFSPGINKQVRNSSTQTCLMCFKLDVSLERKREKQIINQYSQVYVKGAQMIDWTNHLMCQTGINSGGWPISRNKSWNLHLCSSLLQYSLAIASSQSARAYYMSPQVGISLDPPNPYLCIYQDIKRRSKPWPCNCRVMQALIRRSAHLSFKAIQVEAATICFLNKKNE